jgi:glycosyltransferase involved in cell wall biosynthesis
MSAYPAPARTDTVSRDPSPAPLPPRITEARGPGRRPLSAIVTTYNEAATIADCLHSLTWCDEVLIVDSHSTDGTREIARGFERVRVLERPYFGAASQKNWAIDRCRFDWVLILDADERVTPELRREIESVLSAPDSAGAYTIRRRTFALGKRVRFSGWQHDRVVRLFERRAARYPNRRVHADMRTLDPPSVLDEALDHDMVSCLNEYAERTRRYAHWGAAQLWRDGRRRAGFLEIVVRPAWRFLRTYVFQLGFIEGFRGLVMCGLPAYGTFLKYATVRSWQIQKRQGREPDLPAFDDDPTTWIWPPDQQTPHRDIG